MTSNGSVETDPLAALREYADEVAAFSREEAERLGAGLAREQRLQAEIKGLLEASQARERGMRRAVEALTGPPPSKPGPKSRSAGKGQGWTISESKVQDVWDIIREQIGGPFTPPRITEYGVSGEAVRRSLVVLRNQELIRVTGSSRGGGKKYDLMPGAAGHTKITLTDADRELTHGA